MTQSRTKDPQLLAELSTLRARVTELESRLGQVDKSVLSTVSAPAALQEPFLRAQDYVARYFGRRVEDPQRSTITISGERYILVRAASMSVEFFDLVSSLYQDRGEPQAQAVAKNLLFDLAHALGKADARAFHAKMKLTDPIEKLSAGPIHFSFAGWAFVSILPESRPAPDDSFFLLYDHPFSFESDAWVKQGRSAQFPVCIMSAGYSSGWCEESFDMSLVATEVTCQARGDAQCRFVMAQPTRIEEHLAAYLAPKREAASEHVEVPEFFQRKRLEDALERSRLDLEDRVKARTAELALANRKLEAEIVERKVAEELRNKLEQQVRHKQKLESLGVLAGGIAHDFNNLLVGILGNAGLCRMQIDPASPAQATLQGLETAAERAADLTRQMLAYSGRGSFVVELLDLSALVHEMSGLLSSAVSKNARIIRELATGLPPVEGDATELRQVVMNLITNAAESLPAGGGQIWLRTGKVEVDDAYLAEAYVHDGAQTGPHVFVEVADDGCGMDEATRARIFDPFFTTKFAGRGLGLAALLGIVRGHRGIIKLVSEVGRGTVFTICLPVAKGKVAQTAPPKASSNLEKKAMQQTVLVVDDEPIVRDLAAMTLREGGFDVLTAASGAEALSLHQARGADISLVLLDLTMPGMNGEQTLRALREYDRRVYVIISSGYAKEEAMRHLEAHDRTGFIQKPYRAAELLARVRSALAS